jgi:hypothetical protein
MTGNGTPPNADKNLGEIVSEVSEKASLLVRQEIDLAKAEITQKVGKLTRGAAVGAAAGVFLIFGITMFFHTLAWFLFDIFDFNAIWYGFAIVTGLLFLLAILAAFIAYRLFKKGAPPTPDLAIEEAKLIREQFETQGVERDQLERSKS